MYIIFTEDVMLLISSAGIGLCDSNTQQLLQRRTRYMNVPAPAPLLVAAL